MLCGGTECYIPIFLFLRLNFLKINESRCIALLVPRGSIKKLFSIDCVDIYISQSIVNYLHRYFFFNRFKSVGVTPHCLYRDSLTLIYSYKLDPVFCLEKKILKYNITERTLFKEKGRFTLLWVAGKENNIFIKF